MAALANGVLAHAFEMDSPRQPSAGIHLGATLTPPGLAIAEDLDASGRALITAFVAGNEVMSRIGLAAKHSSENLGFHGLQATIPHLTRASPHRCFQRHDISRLAKMEGGKPKKKLKKYPLGHVHIDIAEVHSEEGKLSLFVAIDRSSKLA